jgi:CRISPR system Cascade subunit CasE
MYFVQTTIDLVAAARHVSKHASHTASRDVSFVCKTVLSEGLCGSDVLRPWALRDNRDGKLTIVAYSQMNPDEVDRRKGFALPEVQSAIGKVLGYPLPALRTGEKFRFRIRLCPTIRSTKRGETDAFLIAADEAGKDANLLRDDVYRDFIAARIAGAEVGPTSMTGFRLTRFARKSKKASTGFATRAFPDAEMVGHLVVTDPSVFAETLAAGIGRQRAFGYGMLQLSPD